MAKKGSRLREFEKNNRTLDISSKQKARKEKKREKLKLVQEEGAEANALQTGTGSGKKHRINWIRMGSVVFALVLVVFAGFTVKNIYDLKEREASLMEENLRLQMVKEELEMQVANIDSDSYIEEKARRDLKLVKGNELIFYFPEEYQVDQLSGDSEQAESGKDKEEGKNE